MASTPFPIEQLSPEIGRLAELCFENNCSTNWLPHRITGSDDFGFDSHVQVKVGQEVRYAFRAQSKGSRTSQLNADGSYFSVEVETKTLNYYLNVDGPILLVFSDLSTHDDHRDCSTYYLWIHEVLVDLAGEKDFLDDSQDSHTFRVPKANRLNRLVDLQGDLERFSRFGSAARRLGVALDGSMPGTEGPAKLAVMGDVQRGLSEGGQDYRTLLESDYKQPWPEAQPNSIARKLHDVSLKLDHGDIAAARRLLAKIESTGASASPHEQAEILFSEGRIASIEGNEHQAEVLFKRAVDAYSGDDRYLLALADSRFRHSYVPGDPFDPGSILEIFQNLKTHEADQLRVRLLASAQRLTEAEKILTELPSRYGYVVRCIVQVMEKNWDGVLATAEQGMADPELGDRAIANLRMFRLRALFHRAVGPDFEGGPEHRLPSSGPPNLNVLELREAWREAAIALEEHRRMGWPLSTEYLVDLVAVTAVVFNEEDKVLPSLRELSEQRPAMQGAHHALQHVAVNAGNLPLALEALRRQEETADRIMQEIGTLYSLRRHHEAVKLLDDNLNTFPADHPWLAIVDFNLELTHWGCGVFLGLIHPTSPRLSRYSIGLR